MIPHPSNSQRPWYRSYGEEEKEREGGQAGTDRTGLGLAPGERRKGGGGKGRSAVLFLGAVEESFGGLLLLSRVPNRELGICGGRDEGRVEQGRAKESHTSLLCQF